MDQRREFVTSTMQDDGFFERGWRFFPFDPALAQWVERALPAARRAVSDPANARWLRCGGTWFAGVDALGCDASGAAPGGPALSGTAVDFIVNALGQGPIVWDPGQVSVCYPGYPRPMAGETEAAFRYRRDRDAAHVDGLLVEGPDRRRHLREHHGFLLGIPMVEAGPGAAPFVVWQGSHRIIGEMFQSLFAGIAPEGWGEIDATEIYHATRSRIFESCRRVEVAGRPGEAWLVHRFALHGIAPWADGAKAGPDGRMVVYFRPEIADRRAWLDTP